MTSTFFEILMIIALGTLAGTGLGLALGYITGKQRNSWSLMTRRQRAVNLLLVVVCTGICTAALGWYSFFIATSV
jgi:hypothetical protein